MHKTTSTLLDMPDFGLGRMDFAESFFFLFFSARHLLESRRTGVTFFLPFFLFNFSGILASTHLLRFFLKKTGWIKFSLNKVIGLFIISVMVTGLLSYYGAKSTAMVTGTSLVRYEKNENLKQAIAKEKSMGLAGTQYYLADKNNPKDSLSIAAATTIRNNTGWYRDTCGNMEI